MFKNKAKRLFRVAKLQHHRQQNNGEAATAAGEHELEETALVKQEYFDSKQCHRAYSCAHCRAHLADHDQLISKLFQGNHGRAYLFNSVVNIGCKQAVQRELLTGLHAVADIYCDNCETTLGWKYEQAFVPSQKYKEGKYIIELVHMLKENNWDLTSYNGREIIRDATELELERSQQDNNNCHRNRSISNISNSTKFQHQYQYQYQYHYTSPAAIREKQQDNDHIRRGDPQIRGTNDAITIDDRPCSVIIADDNNPRHPVLEVLVVDGETLLEASNNDNNTSDNLLESSKNDNDTVTNPPKATTTRASDDGAAAGNRAASNSETRDGDSRETDSIEVIERSLAKLMAATAASDQVLISAQSISKDLLSSGSKTQSDLSPPPQHTTGSIDDCNQ